MDQLIVANIFGLIIVAVILGAIGSAILFIGLNEIFPVRLKGLKNWIKSSCISISKAIDKSLSYIAIICGSALIILAIFLIVILF